MSERKEYLMSLGVSAGGIAGVLTVIVHATSHKDAIEAARARIVSLGLRPGELVKARQRASGFSTAWEPVETDATGGLRT